MNVRELFEELRTLIDDGKSTYKIRTLDGMIVDDVDCDCYNGEVTIG